MVPPPERRTVVGRLEESVMMDATDVSVGAGTCAWVTLGSQGPTVGTLLEVLPSGLEPSGAELVLVAATLPSNPALPPKRRFRVVEEELPSLSLDV